MKVAVWAHRGARLELAENTLEAFAKAYEIGADGCELDVQRTRDGHLVVIHDEDLERVSGRQAKVAELSWAELQTYNVAAYKGVGTARVPELVEVLDLIRANGRFLNIELKTGVVRYRGIEQEVWQLVRAMGLVEQVLFSSFNPLSIRQMAGLCGPEAAGLLYEKELSWPRLTAKLCRCRALHPDRAFVREAGYIERAHAMGQRVHIWTVNERAEIERLMRWGADAIISDDPRVALMIRKELSIER